MVQPNYYIEQTDETEYSGIKNIRYLEENELQDFLTHDQTIIEIRHAGDVFGAIRSPTRANIIKPRLNRDNGRLSFKLDVSGTRIDPSEGYTADE